MFLKIMRKYYTCSPNSMRKTATRKLKTAFEGYELSVEDLDLSEDTGNLKAEAMW